MDGALRVKDFSCVEGRRESADRIYIQMCLILLDTTCEALATSRAHLWPTWVTAWDV